MVFTLCSMRHMCFQSAEFFWIVSSYAFPCCCSFTFSGVWWSFSYSSTTSFYKLAHEAYEAAYNTTHDSRHKLDESESNAINSSAAALLSDFKSKPFTLNNLLLLSLHFSDGMPKLNGSNYDPKLHSYDDTPFWCSTVSVHNTHHVA